MSDSPKKDLAIMRQLLEVLLRKSFRLWDEGKDMDKESLSDNAISNHQYMIESFPPIKLEKLEKIVGEAASNSLSLERKIHLPPLNFDSEFIPILSTTLDLDKSPPEISFRIEMYRYKSESGCKLQAIAFRFEGGHKDSLHDYYHVQLTTECHGTSLPDCPKWIPQQIPCIPILMDSSVVSMLFCVLVSLYGKGFYPKIFRSVRIDDKYTNSLRHILWIPKV